MSSFQCEFFKNDIFGQLYRAICVGNVNKVNYIIDSFNPFFHLPWEECQGLLSIAITYRKTEEAKILLKKGCKVRDTMAMYPTALYCDDTELIELLIKRDPNSLCGTHHGDTILHLAIRDNKEPIVKLLIDCGTNLNLRGRTGMFPINLAALMGNINILNMLLVAGANIESKYIDGDSSLSFAVKYRSLEMVKLLLKHGASCNVKGNVVLIDAIRKGNAEKAKVLIDAGVDLNQVNHYGQTPLHVACMSNYRHLISLLLSAGADINVTDDFGMVPCEAFKEKHGTFTDSTDSFLLMKHLMILKEGNLYLHETNEAFLDEFMDFYSKPIAVNNYVILYPSKIVNDVIEKCQKQVNLMKEVKTCSGSTLYSILQKANNPLNRATSGDINLLSSVIKENQFPYYTGIFRALLKLATLRNSLLAEAQELLASILSLSEFKITELPEEMRMCVVSYLNNYELELFLKNF